VNRGHKQRTGLEPIAEDTRRLGGCQRKHTFVCSEILGCVPRIYSQTGSIIDRGLHGILIPALCYVKITSTPTFSPDRTPTGWSFDLASHQQVTARAKSGALFFLRGMFGDIRTDGTCLVCMTGCPNRNRRVQVGGVISTGSSNVCRNNCIRNRSTLKANVRAYRRG